MTADADLPRSAAFQWNAGGWFGGQFGGTFWMLLGGLFLFPVDARVAWITLAVYAAVNGLGLFLWSRRRRIRPHPAIQIFIGATGLAAAGLFLLWRGIGREGIQEAFGGQSSYLDFWWLLIFPALMLLFYVQEKRAQQA